jgi:hypothetical protein
MVTHHRWLCWLLALLLPLEALALAGSHFCERRHGLRDAAHHLAHAGAAAHEAACPHAQSGPSAPQAPKGETGLSHSPDNPGQANSADSISSQCDACGACVLVPLPVWGAAVVRVTANFLTPIDDPRFSSALLALLEPPPRR